MTDRIGSIHVVLEEYLRDDDPQLQRILIALGMVHGVAKVVSTVTSPTEGFIGEARANVAWRRRLLALLDEDLP